MTVPKSLVEDVREERSSGCLYIGYHVSSNKKHLLGLLDKILRPFQLQLDHVKDLHWALTSLFLWWMNSQSTSKKSNGFIDDMGKDRDA